MYFSATAKEYGKISHAAKTASRVCWREQRYKTNYYLLKTMPGIGPLTAAAILVEIGDVKRFETFYHLSSFVGLLPMEHSSSESKSKGMLTVRKTPAAAQ